ncbi:four helix bundle protein [Patescibacteria group bacterium]|nr:four helix bundle protein [Patescibacteria group bacterium]
MDQLNFHKNSAFNAPPQPIVIGKEKEAYQSWQALHRNFPRTERFSLGQKISQTFIEVLELTFTASYLSPEQKIILLTKASSRLDVLKFFVQLAWESKLMPTEKYLELSKKLEEIGRMLGGWRKGLLQKKTLTR